MDEKTERKEMVFFSSGREDWGYVCQQSANGAGQGGPGIIPGMLGFNNSAGAKRMLTFKTHFYLSKKLKAAARVLSGA